VSISAANQQQEIPLWLQPPLDRSRPTGSPKSRQWPPARFAAFAVICSEISVIVRFVPVSLAPIIQQHRGKSLSCDYGNFVVAGSAVRRISFLRASLLDHPVVATYQPTLIHEGGSSS
jgi:hypothetical protein